MHPDREEDGMSNSPPRTGLLPDIGLSVALLLALPLAGCGNPGEGTVQVSPNSRHLGADPVTKQRPGTSGVKSKGTLEPAEPGKLPPGRGRASD
jgi:hypothetical protein